MNGIQVLTDRSSIADFISNTWRPYGFDKNTGGPVDNRGQSLVNNRDLRANAFLSREEWEVLDGAIIARAQQRFQIVSDLQAAGLTSNTTLAEQMSKWKVASERVAADVSMDFETKGTEDRIEYKHYFAPLPIISAEFSVGRRELLSSRTLGADMDTVNATEAGRAVAEMLEVITIDGDSGIVVDGNQLYGLQNLSARYTTTAAGDFGTLSNVYETFRATLSTMAGRRYYGPFRVYIANAQYFEMLKHYSDGSSEMALDRVLKLPQIMSIEPNDLVDDGEFLMVQMTPDVIDLRVGLDMETRRWEAPDGSRLYYKVMMAAVPRIKTDYAGYAGVAHITSC